MNLEKVRTVCPFCGTGCGIELNVSQGKVVGVTPDWSSPVSEGALCVKGQFGTGFIHSPDRLTTPLVRRNGELQEATWEEAAGVIASSFGRIKDELGGGGFAVWSSSRSINESNFMLQKFAHTVLGTNNVDNCSRT
jgi:predicted molibdopterin-dependent oxidoreductase YjgC